MEFVHWTNVWLPEFELKLLKKVSTAAQKLAIDKIIRIEGDTVKNDVIVLQLTFDEIHADAFVPAAEKSFSSEIWRKIFSCSQNSDYFLAQI